MAPPKGKKGALEEQVRDVLVMAHFLENDNRPAYAEQIRRSWDSQYEENIIKVLPKEVGPRMKSLSLAGTIQICERLSSPERAILSKDTSKFGEKRRVVTYSLSETAEGFRKIARTMLSVSIPLFYRSHYTRHCLRDVWIPEIRRRFRIEPGSVPGLELALRRSPTALMITLEKDFGPVFDQGRWDSGEEWRKEAEAWGGACILADALVPSRSPRVNWGAHPLNFKVRAQVESEGPAGFDLGGEGRITWRPTFRSEASE